MCARRRQQPVLVTLKQQAIYKEEEEEELEWNLWKEGVKRRSWMKNFMLDNILLVPQDGGGGLGGGSKNRGRRNKRLG